MSLEGQQIGRYRFLRLLGSGGMGNVYLAEDARIEQQVAVKVIRAEGALYPNALTDQDGIRLFRREAKAIARLDHPNILPLFDYGEERLGDTMVIYLVMPYRQEGSLASWLRQRLTSDLLSHQEVDHIVCQAAEALQHAHNRHIIHQDVKPSNFLLRQREETPTLPDVLLADFGIARFMTAISSTSQSISGTPTYMAPEQWEGEPVFATDQYALAVMTYELLTGRPPFQGGPGRMMYQHINIEPPPPTTLNRCLSQEIDEVLLHALAKSSEQRFASITAFASAIHEAVQDMQNDHAPTLLGPSKTSFDIDAIDAVPAISTMNETHPVASSAEFEEPHPVDGKDSTETQPAAVDHSSTQQAANSAVAETIYGPAPDQQGVKKEVQEDNKHIDSPSNLGIASWVQTNLITVHPSSTRRKSLPAIALILLLLLIGSGVAYAMPGVRTTLIKDVFGTSSNVSGITSSAIVSITPTSTDMKKIYTLSAVTGVLNASKHQVRARLLSSTTLAQTQTVNATGQVNIKAATARGLISLYNPNSYDIGLGNYPFQDANGINITVSVYTHAHSSSSTTGYGVKVGASSNIPAYDFNHQLFNLTGGGSMYVTNTTAFTGGRDAAAYTTVQQSDIDASANALIMNNKPNPLHMLQVYIQPNEHLVGSPQCKPNVSSDHAAGDKATNVTVTVSFTCTGEVYNGNGARAMATDMLKTQATTDLGSGYALVGNVATSVSNAAITDARSGTITLTINTEGVWVYQFSDAQKQVMAKLIAGKSEKEARVLLLEQAGMKQADIQISRGNGNTLPMVAKQITFIVQSISGI